MRALFGTAVVVLKLRDVLTNYAPFALQVCASDVPAFEKRFVEGYRREFGFELQACVRLSALLFYNEVKSCRPVNLADSMTQPFHESSPCPWQQRSPLLSTGQRPPIRRR